MRLLGVLAGVGLALTACGAELRAAPPQSTAVISSPVGKSYLSVKLTENGEVKQLVPGTRIRLDFRDSGALGFHAGCNQLGGLVSLDGGTLSMDAYGGTEVGCPARQTQEEWLARFLLDKPKWNLEADLLSITTGGTTLTLQEVKE